MLVKPGAADWPEDDPQSKWGEVSNRRRENGFRVCAVSSGKGGVCKSNIVANLGLALARQGLRVLLMDADLGLGNLDLLLGLKPQYTIQEVLQLKKTLDEVILTGPGGMKILPAASGIAELADLGDTQKLLLLDELDHYREQLDVALIDTGAGISRNVLFFNLAAQERLVVANNQPPALMDAYALMKVLATHHGETRFYLVVNDVASSQEASVVYHSLLKVAEKFLPVDISLEYLGFIPHDAAIPKAVKRQQPVLELFPQSAASQAFMAVARRFWDTPAPPGRTGNIKLFWRRLSRYAD